MTRGFIRLAVLGFLVVGVGYGAFAAESSSSAASTASLGDGAVDVRLGGLVFEAGADVALEFAQDPGVDCFDGGVLVERLALIDGVGHPVHEVVYETAVDADVWLGRVGLRDADGLPLPPGAYRLEVATSVGSFAVEIEITDATSLRALGRFSATASVCGLSLRVYRLVTEADGGAHLAIRVGDRLLVALEGNPTTGYEWLNAALYEYAILRESEEREFRPDSDLIGSGGVFLFRYETVDVGPQAFRFVFQRPWESVQPLEVLEFTVDVY